MGVRVAAHPVAKPTPPRQTLKVCSFWKAGRCTRHPCPFLHRDLPPPPPHRHRVWRNPSTGSAAIPSSKPSATGAGASQEKPVPSPRPVKNQETANGDGPANPGTVCSSFLAGTCSASQEKPVPSTRPVKNQETANGDGPADPGTVCSSFLAGSCSASQEKPVPSPRPVKNQETAKGDGPADPGTVCSSFLAGTCSHGDRCWQLHAYSVGDSFSHVATLEGHQNAITGIALASGSNKLFSGSKDGIVRIWDCITGKCIQILNLGVYIGCMISDGPWVFVGVPDAVKAYNTETHEDICLVGPKGQVYALATSDNTLFAGSHDGVISAWKSGSVGGLGPSASLTGHGGAVVALRIGADRLYSGSTDHTIKVWDLASLQCTHILTGHASAVMSILCWDQYMLSCSLDKTIKVWAATEDWGLEVIHTHSEEHGLLALLGMHDDQPERQPVLLVSCNDNSVRLYDLPTFFERGRIFSKEEVRTIQLCAGGLFFTGDGTGELKVWKWRTNEKPVTA